MKIVNHRVKLAVGIALVGMLGAAATAVNVDLKPGKYRLTVTYEVQDQRQNELRTTTRCIQAGDLTDPEKIFNDRTGATPAHEDACSVRGFKSADGRISYDADCSNRTVHVDGAVSRTGFMVVRAVRPKASGGVTLKFTVRANWIGDCQAAARH